MSAPGSGSGAPAEDAAMVGVAETLAFLDRALPARPGALLEVGCGRGEVARGLAERGWRVVALDRDAGAVAAARAAGVDARVASFPDAAAELLGELPPGTGGFDALLFVRLLHHVPLGPCLDAARRLVRPGGTVAIEDYDWERVDRVAATWAYGMLGAFAAAGLVSGTEWDPEGDALAKWRRTLSAEGLHGGAAMAEALASRFELDPPEHAPYFYRYFARHLAPGPEAVRVTAHALATERALIEAGAIGPLGLRFVARRAAAPG